MPRTRNGYFKAYYPARWNAVQRWWKKWIAFWAELAKQHASCE